MKRRAFITLLGGAAAAWPLAARAQQPERMRRVGVLISYPEAQSEFASFMDELRKLGWVDGRNLRIDTRWGIPADPDSMHRFARELVALQPDLILSHSTPTTAALLQETRIIPIVFATVADPVGSGFVASLARPGGNVTGLSDVATTLSTKRLSLLKEMLPQLRRVAMLWNKGDRGMSLRYEASAVAARELGVIVQPLGVSEPDDFIGAFDTMDRERPDAILMVSDSLTLLNRRRVFEYAAERRLPAIYETDSLTREGGLMSYGPDRREIFERSAALADRIFKGAKPADLPVEQPTRFLFVLNLKTAKAMGLNVPNTLLALADEVVE